MKSFILLSVLFLFSFKSIAQQVIEDRNIFSKFFCHNKNGNLLKFNDSYVSLNLKDNRPQNICTIDSLWCFNFETSQILINGKTGGGLRFELKETNAEIYFNDSLAINLREYVNDLYESKGLNATVDTICFDFLDVFIFGLTAIQIRDEKRMIQINIYPDRKVRRFLIRKFVPYQFSSFIFRENDEYFLRLRYRRDDLNFIQTYNYVDSFGIDLFTHKNKRISSASYDPYSLETGGSFTHYLYFYNRSGRLKENFIEVKYCEQK